ncbi:MAG TPA: hypothetical protein ACQGQI_03695 [Xylella sp.]
MLGMLLFLQQNSQKSGATFYGNNYGQSVHGDPSAKTIYIGGDTPLKNERNNRWSHTVLQVMGLLGC